MSADAGNVPYRVALPEFEGPLDLLLHLCKTHEIEIVNIPIAFITEKYLEYLELMQTMPVDIAADYLVMAATLAYLKSRELVPSPEPLEVVSEEEGEVLDPREELIRRLLQYQKYKDAAEKLGARPIEGRNVFPRGADLEGPDGPGVLAEHSVWKLIESFGKLLEKAGSKLTHDVTVDRISISVRINQLIDRIESGGGSFRFDSCFDMSLPEDELRNQVVVTLLAILELARLKVIRVLAAPDAETLFIAQVEGAALQAARRAEVTSATEGDGDEDGDADPEDDVGERVARAAAEVLATAAATAASSASASASAASAVSEELVVDEGVAVEEGVAVDEGVVVEEGVAVEEGVVVEEGVAAGEIADAAPATETFAEAPAEGTSASEEKNEET